MPTVLHNELSDPRQAFLYNQIMLFPLVLPPLQTGVQGGLDTPVTYSQPAKSVAAVLADVSKATSVQLGANAESAREVVLISVNALPLKSLMDKIAFVTSCQWQLSGDKYTLEPSTSVRNRELAEEIAHRTSKMKQALQTKLDNLTKTETAMKNAESAKTAESGKSDNSGKSDDEEVTVGAGADGMFGFGGQGDEKAITLLLQFVDPALLAQVEDGNRGVWATNNATQVQIGLSGDCAPIISSWIAEHNAGIPKGAVATPEGDNLAALPQAMQDMIKAKSSPVTEPASKAILVVERMPFMDVVQVTLKAFDSNGKVLLTGQSSLESSMMDAIKKMAEAAKPSAQSSGTTSTPIVYSEVSKELQTAVAGSSPGVGHAKLSPELRAKILHPEINDPLGFIPTDVFTSVAKSRHRQLVADLPDTVFGGARMQMASVESYKTIEEAEAAISHHDLVQASDDGQFLYLRPAQPAEARLHRVDRASLRTLLETTETKQIPGLDDIADFALVNEDPMENGLEMSYLALACPGVMSSMMMNGMQSNWSLYRIYGSLGSNERQTLKSGGSLPFANLSGTQQAFCSAYLYSSGSSIEADGANVSHDMVSRMMSRFMGSGGDYRDEPTEVMPNGLPAGGSISCSASAEPMVLVGDGEGMLSNWALGPQEFALFRMVTKAAPAGGDQVKLPKQGMLGTRLKLGLTFHVGPKLSAYGELTDPYVDKSASPSNLAALPGDFEVRIAAELQALQKSTMGSLMQMVPMGKEVTPP